MSEIDLYDEQTRRHLELIDACDVFFDSVVKYQGHLGDSRKNTYQTIAELRQKVVLNFGEELCDKAKKARLQGPT